jgi:hypothetical protein
MPRREQVESPRGKHRSSQRYPRQAEMHTCDSTVDYSPRADRKASRSSALASATLESAPASAALRRAQRRYTHPTSTAGATTRAPTHTPRATPSRAHSPRPTPRRAASRHPMPPRSDTPRHPFHPPPSITQTSNTHHILTTPLARGPPPAAPLQLPRLTPP